MVHPQKLWCFFSLYSILKMLTKTKKKIKSIVLATLMMAGVSFGYSLNSQAQDVNPWCPNGCVSGGDGCFCYYYFPQYSEYDWGDSDA